MLTARLADNSDEAIETARKMLLDEARQISVASNISEHEFGRTLNNFEATFRFSNLGYLAKATNLALAEYHGEDINRTIAERRLLTPAAVAAEADRLFNHTPFATLIYLGG